MIKIVFKPKNYCSNKCVWFKGKRKERKSGERKMVESESFHCLEQPLKVKERKFCMGPTQKSFPRYFGRKAGRFTKILGKMTFIPFFFIKFYKRFLLSFKFKSLKNIACSHSPFHNHTCLLHLLTLTTFQLLCKVSSLFFCLIWVL
jgi:hypothetical protein